MKEREWTGQVGGSDRHVTGRIRQYRTKSLEINMTFGSLGWTARPRQAPGMIRKIERTRAVHLQVLPNPVNRNTCGKSGFLEASI